MARNTPSVIGVGTAYGTAANAAATASFTGGTMPTHATGDLLLMFVVVDAGASTTATITAPSGWTELTTLAWGTTANILFGRVYGKLAASSGETFTAPAVTNLTTGTSGGGGHIRVVSLRDVDTASWPGTPASVLSGTPGILNTSATTATSIGSIPGLTPADPSTLFFVFGGHANGGTANVGNVLSGDSLTWTERFDDVEAGGGDSRAILDTAPQGDPATAVAAKTFTFSTAPTAGRNGGVAFAIKGTTIVPGAGQAVFAATKATPAAQTGPSWTSTPSGPNAVAVLWTGALAAQPVTASVSDTITVSDSLTSSVGRPRAISDAITVKDGAPNELTNPGADTDLTLITANGAATLTRVTPGRDGTGGMPHIVATADTQGVHYRASTGTGKPAAVIGDQVRLSVWARSTTDSGKYIELFASYRDATDTVLVESSGIGFQLSSSWQQFIINFTVPSGSGTIAMVSLKVLAYNNAISGGSGAMAFDTDDASVMNLTTGGGAGLVGTVGSSGTSYPRSISDTVTVSDALTSVGARPRTVADTVTISDALTSIGARPRALADTATVSDALTRVGARPRAIADTVTVSDALTSVGARARVLADTVTVSDALTASRGVSRSLADTVTVSDALTRAGGTRPRALADTVTVSDALTSVGARARTLADTVTVSDALAGSRGVSRALADTVTISDSLTRAGGTRPRALADTVTVSDALTRITGVSKALADTVTVSDALTSVRGVSRALADTVTVSDVLTRTIGRNRTLSDTITLSDSLARMPTAPQSLSLVAGDELVTVSFSAPTSDGGSAILYYEVEALDAIQLIDAIVLTDTLTRAAGTKTRALADTTTVSDALTRTLGRSRTLADTFTVADALTRAGGTKPRAAADSFTVADALTRASGTKTRTLAESFTIADALARAKAGARAAADSWAVSDALGRATGRTRAIPETAVTVNDTLTRLTHAARAVSDTLTISDAVEGHHVSPSPMLKEPVVAIIAALDYRVTLSDPATTATVVKLVREAALTGSNLSTVTVNDPTRTAVVVPRTGTVDLYYG